MDRVTDRRHYDADSQYDRLKMFHNLWASGQTTATVAKFGGIPVGLESR